MVFFSSSFNQISLQECEKVDFYILKSREGLRGQERLPMTPSL